jgi:hypothetical protein
MNRQKEKLYRKDNKLANHYEGDKGSDYRHDRHSKKTKVFLESGSFLSIKKRNKGMDYTPLYKFLLSKVGCNWDEVHSEAVSRLDKQDPIWYMVKLDVNPVIMGGKSYPSSVVWMGDTSQYSALTVNEDRILVKIDENAKPYPPSCSCCTFTFNGVVIPKMSEKTKLERRKEAEEERNRIFNL